MIFDVLGYIFSDILILWCYILLTAQIAFIFLGIYVTVLFLSGIYAYILLLLIIVVGLMCFVRLLEYVKPFL